MKKIGIYCNCVDPNFFSFSDKVLKITLAAIYYREQRIPIFFFIYALSLLEVQFLS